MHSNRCRGDGRASGGSGGGLDPFLGNGDRHAQ